MSAITLPSTPTHDARLDNDPGNAEDVPLNVDFEHTQEAAVDEIGKPEERIGDAAAQMTVLVATGIFTLVTWAIVFANEPFGLGWFFWHPVLQSTAIAFFVFGILTLQPTSKPTSKVLGFRRHQRIMLGAGLPAISIGTSAMWLNKTIHSAPHATTWHGTCGYITISWIITQAFIGGGSVWFGGRLFGGNPQAKLVWKYHRLSGYFLLPMLLFTAHLGGAWSDWVTTHSWHFLRIIAYIVCPILTFVGVFIRIRVSKMKFF
ncbi:uncharacterized protein FIBRA_06011 [Fibroporia radiculosa]|uniref:Cytochrome b561 domain-containing protein n=1 Tax=Fibroporia radiculosa TaxID=599839 RepID=J4IB13_9APHY|nr:uncharacterized protein FIBRA_06011 [Fibroporia radiculosa]CCM03861.1 predicted protein [Fibroporia radiculosa]